MKTKSAQQWEDLINAAGVPPARVRRVDEALREPQTLARSVLQDGERVPEGGTRLRAPTAGFGCDADGPQ